MSGPTDYYLGVDGGGTGCRALLCDAAGREIGEGRGGPANVNSDRGSALSAILDASSQALDGIAPERVTAVLGLAGAEVSSARDWLVAELPFGRAQVVQDAVIATAGALGDRDGIVATLGTGSVFSRQLGGAFRLIGGRGPVLGDEAGGSWLGRQLLSRVLRAADGHAAITPLAQRLLDRMGGVPGIVTFASRARPSDFGGLVADILAATDDPLAAALLAEADTHVAAAIGLLQQTETLPVAFVGGLGPIYQARLAGRWPIVAPLASPLHGAVQMARAMVAA
ncbi:ATPase [Paracoccus sp. TK19116]|uniref:ATPase n=1 Tax=Paracoccus albicereus TaxID=2922394 RepID=A0ABT1MRE2_9RHOB|nr:BadF/BadG/BcrA/BcrD ATPase family protein [Paracoccus albicereus]MCQ0970873.1 ATPase [Paracoccus albicereus]